MEFVFVIKRRDLFDRADPQGFQRLGERELEERYLRPIREKAFFLERRHAERDSSFKQVIPYCLVTSEGKILLLRRLKGQGESRLHDMLSIGVGGHINPEDRDGDVLRGGTMRELREELEIDGEFRIDPVGILNDDSTEVGSVHFGLVQKVTVSRGAVRVRERKLMEGSFVIPGELRDLAREDGAFETWSRFLIQDLDGILKD